LGCSSATRLVTVAVRSMVNDVEVEATIAVGGLTEYDVECVASEGAARSSAIFRAR
jgi:hypothetical protein